MLEIKNLHANIAETETPIINGLNLTVANGEVAAIMGPNGAGKSTLSYIIAGHPSYEVTEGDILFNNISLLDLEPASRAALGIFLAFQYPLEIPGLATMEFLKVALNSQKKKRGEEPLSTPEFIKEVKAAGAVLDINIDMLKRALNVGFSGGEKKRIEMLQMLLLQPKLGVLDETDSGLDIDALKIVAQGVNSLRSAERSFLVITHYQRLLNYIVPDTVHILHKGRIIKSGDKSLALHLEKNGYAEFIANDKGAA
ncbi:Fe-S cluster assembly ATPase SufC [Bartonella sp. TP]|uniref:Fe-S cluster assembly ATPase SufC n=1 Tax=Bartonella sp. TP TaxID=3057550 RepID=UPI0025B19913|nr:Fe-S cluster assembly ATPase SufC [Bartonella sp. TP]MDN5249277.1 Fe-S cluster assembly ATPase SufC [Alphaproteobacteria bacterium]WJW79961.1 Fe-S cluster assembly ATPase SufC [Bartonella sp. TP]